MKENVKKEPFESDNVKTTDIYLAAYLLIVGANIEGLEVTKELDKEVCIITLEKDLIKTFKEAYITGKAKVDPVLYQKAINRIKDIMFKSIANSKTSYSGGIK